MSQIGSVHYCPLVVKGGKCLCLVCSVAQSKIKLVAVMFYCNISGLWGANCIYFCMQFDPLLLSDVWQPSLVQNDFTVLDSL